MQVIEIPLGEFSRRRRSVSVAHTRAGLRRGLDIDEQVLVLCDGEFRNASVAGIEFSLEDTHYQLDLGGLVPAEMAYERIAGVPLEDSRLHELVDLLGSRPAEPVLPEQRRRSRSS